MGEPDPSKEATVAWLRDQFRRHYASRKPTLPDRFGRREFGFMFWSPGMVQRHIGFSREDQLRGFLQTRVPAHVYYSSAYYEKPDAPTMEEKGWLGADLIFDLDADHIPGANKMSYSEMLEAVRLRITQLYDEFLVEDFGFGGDELRLVFSGGRGYHIHVADEAVWSLGSHERREIVDWITAKGLDLGTVFKEPVFDAREFKGRLYAKRQVVMADPTKDVGWPRKIVRGLIQLARQLEPMDRESAVGFLASFEGVERKEAEGLWENLFANRSKSGPRIRGIDRLIETRKIETLSDRNVKLIVAIVSQLQHVRLNEYRGVPLGGITPRGETDEPVTSDIKRLIRMPSSLHGKTGFQVVPLTRDQLDGFRPLRDAIPATWTDEPVQVRLASGITSEMKDETFKLAPGLNDVPQYLAIFLAASRKASVVQEG
ncbi:MAG TPA: DNA primase small subunit PriS [Thermoplasmata archaeon]|nr:DNA primase small subunit PriS [Thermoplasmata archaeon]